MSNAQYIITHMVQSEKVPRLVMPGLWKARIKHSGGQFPQISNLNFKAKAIQQSGLESAR